MNRELIEKAKAAKSTDELLTLARESGIELTEEQAEMYFGQLHAPSELTDEELDAVAGGGCSSEEKCPKCGSTDTFVLRKILNETYSSKYVYWCNNCNRQF